MKRLVFCFALAGSLSALAADLRLSLQAYTFRDRSFVETVETAARLGYTNIEAYPGQRLGGGMEGSTDYHMKPETFAQLKLNRYWRMLERGTIGIAHGEGYALDAFMVHAADGIAATTTHANHLDDVLHQVLNGTKVQYSYLFFHIACKITKYN
jgi:hypothetical protein